jgi:hypothetical protein
MSKLFLGGQARQATSGRLLSSVSRAVGIVLSSVKSLYQ